MPGTDIWKEWANLKKHGVTGLVVAIIFTSIEVIVPLFKPKDGSCENQVKYLQQQNTILVNNLVDKSNESKKKDTIINYYRSKDSAYSKVIKPYTGIIKSKSK